MSGSNIWKCSNNRMWSVEYPDSSQQLSRGAISTSDRHAMNCTRNINITCAVLVLSEFLHVFFPHFFESLKVFAPNTVVVQHYSINSMTALFYLNVPMMECTVKAGVGREVPRFGGSYVGWG